MKTQAKARLRFPDLPKGYAELCRVLLPRPIHDAVEYANVAEIADAMTLWHKEFTPDQADYFDLLCSLMEEYDAENVKWPKLGGREMRQHLLDEHDLAAADPSRILRGERNLTLAHVRKLAAYFKISPELFI